MYSTTVLTGQILSSGSYALRSIVFEWGACVVLLNIFGTQKKPLSLNLYPYGLKRERELTD